MDQATRSPAGTPSGSETSEVATAPADVSPPATPVSVALVTRAPRWRTVAWRHWFREVGVIAAGALAALGAQAWWQNRQDQGRERDYLRQLLVDTRENERRIDGAVANDRVAGQAARRVAGFMYGTGPVPPSDSLAAWFFDHGVFSSSELQPLTGTYAALLSTGDLRLIRDERLRGELVSYAARVDAKRENLRFYTQQAFGDAGRVVRAFPFVRSIFSGDGSQVQAEARLFDFARLRSDADAAAILFSVQAANTNRLIHLRGLRDATRQLRERLEAQRPPGAAPA